MNCDHCQKRKSSKAAVDDMMLPYLQTDDALWNHAQTAQRGRVVCQTFSINGEVLVKWGHREGVHNLWGHKHSKVSFVCTA